MNWINVVFLVARALLLSGAAYAGSKGQSEIAATLGAAAGAITVSGSYTK
jgi:3-deoxy-D-manno-octulosonic acid (KDO) 8-phosphate synthase